MQGLAWLARAAAPQGPSLDYKENGPDGSMSKGEYCVLMEHKMNDARWSNCDIIVPYVK